MEITSLPGPDRTISDEDIQNRRMISRRYRNRRIGDFLKELKLVEGRNTGIPTILRAMDANGSEQPTFKTDDERSYFTVILPVQNKFLVSAVPEQKKKKTRRSLDEIKALILSTLTEEGNLSSSELASTMGYTKVTYSVSKAIKELMEEQAIVYLEPDKIRSRNQKLCLTQKNRENK